MTPASGSLPRRTVAAMFASFALAYFMREHKAFPPGAPLVPTLEFYFQCCSIEVDCEALSILAAQGQPPPRAAPGGRLVAPAVRALLELQRGHPHPVRPLPWNR